MILWLLWEDTDIKWNVVSVKKTLNEKRSFRVVYTLFHFIFYEREMSKIDIFKLGD